MQEYKDMDSFDDHHNLDELISGILGKRCPRFGPAMMKKQISHSESSSGSKGMDLSHEKSESVDGEEQDTGREEEKR